MTSRNRGPRERFPAGARVLAQSVRRVADASWRTSVWREADGTYGVSLVGRAGAEPALCIRQAGARTLGELDGYVAAEIGRRGPRGVARLAVLTAAACAFTQADLRTA